MHIHPLMNCLNVRQRQCIHQADMQNGSSTIVDRVPIGIVDRSRISRTTVNRVPTIGDPPAREESPSSKSNQIRKSLRIRFSRGRFQVIIDHCRQSFRENINKSTAPSGAWKRTRTGRNCDTIVWSSGRTRRETGRGNKSRDARNNFEHNELRVVFREHAERRDWRAVYTTRFLNNCC